ncbi:MAG: LysR family transcriptional regulator [Myxococcota bacterium]
MDMEATLRLLAVVEEGSFAAAARRLGISRQAVHRSIDGLELEAGAPLLDRTTRDLRPTSLARELLPHARRLRDLRREIAATMDRARSYPTGLVRLTAPPVFGETVLTTALMRFVQTWPDVRVLADCESNRTSLLTEDYDLMIRVGAEPPEPHFAVPLGHATNVLCAAPSYLAERGIPASPAHLRNHALLEYGTRTSSQWVFVREGQESAVPVVPRLTSESSRLVVEACLRGAGVLLVPWLAVRDDLHPERLVPVLEAWQLPRRQVWAVYGHRAHDDPTLAALLDELRGAWASAMAHVDV